MEILGTTMIFLGGVAVGSVVGVYTYKAFLRRESLNTQSKNNSTNAQSAPQNITLHPEGNINDVTTINQTKAKEAFMNNLNRFIPKMNMLLMEPYQSEEWTDLIIDINDANLIQLWKKIYNNKNSILRVLSSWGIKPDTCTSFVCMDAHKELYLTSENSQLEIGRNYVVTKPYWVLTTQNFEGKIEKHIILKGEVNYGTN